MLDENMYKSANWKQVIERHSRTTKQLMSYFGLICFNNKQTQNVLDYKAGNSKQLIEKSTDWLLIQNTLFNGK